MKNQSVNMEDFNKSVKNLLKDVRSFYNEPKIIINLLNQFEDENLEILELGLNDFL